MSYTLSHYTVAHQQATMRAEAAGLRRMPAAEQAASSRLAGISDRLRAWLRDPRQARAAGPMPDACCAAGTC